VEQYTIAQAELFIKAAVQFDKEEQRRLLLAVRAVMMDGDDFKTLWSGFE
jgi:hypothetical protein